MGNRTKGFYDSRLWDYIAMNAHDDIQAGGWYSSFGGDPFSKEEMLQYQYNTLEKLKPYLSKDKIVVEIGCASGITMFSIVPYVKEYIGTDSASVNLKRNSKRIEEGSIDNVVLRQCAADKILEIIDEKVDIVIINSVCQYFPDMRYFENVINQCISIINPPGIIFLGDILDKDLQSEFIWKLKEYKKHHPDIKNIKEDRSDELWISRDYFKTLQSKFMNIKEISISNKIGDIHNELTDYRYDVVLQV